MHVGLNLIYLMPGRSGGMETVARELIPALARVRPDLRLTAFVNRETAGEEGPWRDAAEWVTVPVRASNRLDWVRGEQTLLPRSAARAAVTVVHSLGATAPLWGPFRRVLSIYDFNYRLLPDSHNALYGRGLDVLVRLAARRSQRVIACSSHTREDALALLGLPGELVDVVPLGFGASADAAPSSERHLREAFALGERSVVLTLSDKRPHKNLARLLEALALLPAGKRPALVIAGYTTVHERELRSRVTALGLEGDVRMSDWISASDREGLYALASAFVFPSLYEGFGLPVLEAMARGVPVACSNAASLPEVAGDAALSFDPTRSEAIAAALASILGDPRLAERLRRAGRERAASFTWEQTARGTLASYERALAPSS